MNRVWTEEEIEILRRDREARIPIPVTAAKLGRPVPATYARARLIGTLVQPHQSWDEAGVARLRELVSADPPLTDKLIAESLGRSVTQIRWKMQDLGLIGVRDLSKLAKATAAKTARPKIEKPSAPKPVSPKPAVAHAVLARVAAPAPGTAPASGAPVAVDPRAALERALRRLETVLADSLKRSVAASETGMIEAAKAAIAEKACIDQRLADLSKRTANAEAKRLAEIKKAAAEAKRQADVSARLAREEKARQAEAKSAERPKPVSKQAALPTARGMSRAAPPRPAPPSVTPAQPKIVVTEAPAAPRPVEPESGPSQMSGRGGWKSVRRDPARIAAQAKRKAANRADAIDLAQAAQAAIERFISERGVTRTETDAVQSLITRLQARGYIVVREGEGWIIDQRHRLDNESALVAFADARGITLSAAA
ncbi:hypothetical protein [Microvirga roseola]|uniref:hypothetical protein n=1 Tax=Microvirga roseola TaxID=2883126 RepID=UPI001E56EEEF|nr:hypothetical protein [Microvirga roseola]